MHNLQAHLSIRLKTSENQVQYVSRRPVAETSGYTQTSRQQTRQHYAEIAEFPWSVWNFTSYLDPTRQTIHWHFFICILYYGQQMHTYFANDHTPTCFDTISSSSGGL